MQEAGGEIRFVNEVKQETSRNDDADNPEALLEFEF
jgi:hypothetical protein